MFIIQKSKVIGPLMTAVCCALILQACSQPVKQSDQQRRLPRSAIHKPGVGGEHNVYGYPIADHVLQRIGYTAGHDGEYRQPVWVSYRLSVDYCDGKEFVPRERIRFVPDRDLPDHKRALDDDYRRSGYSRGHMAMQSDLRGRSEECERQGCLLSNVCPQKQHLNAGCWLKLENACKNWARAYGEVWIVCGPIFNRRPPARLQGARPGYVSIPTQFYKIVVKFKESALEPEVLAFVMQHEPIPDKNTDLSTFLSSVDDIEKATGLDFFSHLPDDLEDRIEATTATTTWAMN